MNLLNARANKDRQQEDSTRKILRIQEIERILREKEGEMARAEMDFNTMLANNRKVWEDELIAHTLSTKELSDEVTILEKRRAQALIPISIEMDKVTESREELSLLMEALEEKTALLEDSFERLEEKLTDVADREQQVLLREQKATLIEEANTKQGESISTQSRELTEAMQAFHVKQLTDEANMEERKKELYLAEVNFNAKVEKYHRDLEALKRWDIQLKDERETLKREFNRLK